MQFKFKNVILHFIHIDIGGSRIILRMSFPPVDNFSLYSKYIYAKKIVEEA